MIPDPPIHNPQSMIPDPPIPDPPIHNPQSTIPNPKKRKRVPIQIHHSAEEEKGSNPNTPLHRKKKGFQSKYTTPQKYRFALNKVLSLRENRPNLREKNTDLRSASD
jgi:hypothetical protein